MAITLSQKPNRWNLASQPNVYTISGLTTQDRYVLQVQGASGTILATIKQPANPAGVAHFDISRILQAQMSIAWVEDIQRLSPTAGESFEYRVRFGTETNQTTAWTGYSENRYVFNGWDNWRNINWNDLPFNPVATGVNCICEVPPCDVDADLREGPWRYLTNWPLAQSELRSSSYHTLSFFNRLRNHDDGTQWDQNEQPAYVRIKQYDSGNNLIQTLIYSIDQTTGLGPRPNFDSTVIGNYTNDLLVGTVGVGPQNLKDAGLWPTSSAALWNQVSQLWGNYSAIWNLASSTAIVAYYVVDIMSVDLCYWGANGAPANNQAATLENYLGFVIYTHTFTLEDKCTKFEPVTVSFVNQYGVKDYYTFERRNTLQTATQRNNYYQTNGSWSSATFSVDPHGRGQKTFSSEIVTSMQLSTDWMQDEVSKWLEELYTSPHVQVYYDGVWEPAVITTTGYQQKTWARDRMFQHNLEIQFANNKRVQRG